MGNSPFATGAFDAVFMKCLHPSSHEFEEILRTLKVGGALIYSTLECGAMDGINLSDILDDARLLGVELPFESKWYQVFVYGGSLATQQ